MYVGIHVKCSLYLSDFNEDWIFLTDFRKILLHFMKNPSSGNRVVPCEQTDRQTDRHEETKKRFSQFCERAWNLNFVTQHSVYLVISKHTRQTIRVFGSACICEQKFERQTFGYLYRNRVEDEKDYRKSSHTSPAVNISNSFTNFK